ncbi:MAG: hypothetical protein RR547_14105, partial [Raoultibacter sp.]
PYHNDPNYHFGICLDYHEDNLTALAIFVMTDFDEDEALVTPEVLVDCYTFADLEEHGIVLSDKMDEDIPGVLGWYCAEGSVFDRATLENLRTSNERLGGYLDTVIQILEVPSSDLASHWEEFEDISFFDLQNELEEIAQKIDRGELVKPLPFELRLIGEALLGWQVADENDYRA